MINFMKKYSNLIIVIFFLFLVFIFIHNIVGTTILKSSNWNSYELQARAWLKGNVFLDYNYEYLELAIYKGHYFVSFPPFPSVFLLPFVIIFGDTIPTNFISFILFSSCFVILYNILKKCKYNEFTSIFLSLAFTVGTNLFSLSMDSGVWFFAQLLNYLLCLLAVNAFLNKKKFLVYLYLALAVGCRPFSIIYILMFFIYYLITDKDNSFINKLKKNIIYLLPSILVGIVYMWYNYIRFDNIFEFGHNFLPEFLNSTYGQFSFHYLLPNLKELFFDFLNIDYKLHLHFMMPFSFFIANPIIIVYVYRLVKNYLKNKKIDILRLLIMIFIFINIILICFHKTLGGWQFGARYIVDIIPFIFLGLISYKNIKIKLDKLEIICIVFGMILNVFGTIMFFTYKF